MEEDIISLNPKKRCEQYLRTNNVVFKKKVVFGSQKHPVTIFDFVIPGAAIIIRNKIKRSKDKFYEQIHKIYEKLPNNVILYIYIEKLNEYEICENIFEDLSENIKVINSFISIKPPQINFYTADLHVIMAFCDSSQKWKHIELYCDQTTYDYTLVFLNEVEYNNLLKLNIKIQNVLPKPVCILHCGNKIKSCDSSLFHLNPMFEIFKIKINNTNIDPHTMHRVVPNVTFLCPGCNKIFWTRFKVNDKCCKCSNKRKRENNETESPFVFDLFKNVENCHLDLFY